jgi:aspartate kinase
MNFIVNVLKFGGTSVENVSAIHHCASLIKNKLHQNEKLVVVVSAMGSKTDELLKLAFAVSDSPPQRELDMLLSTGERVSCALLSIALDRLQVKSISLTGSQSGILTNKVHQHAEIIDIKCSRILSSFNTHDVVIVAGFQGVDPESKEITTLGRGGSDLTAVALAHKLGAKNCSIYTDVDGVFTMDPRYFKEAQTVPFMSWLTAYKLSCAGAKVLHYRAAALALKNNVPLEILNTRNPQGPKTIIAEKESDSYFITQKNKQSLIHLTVKGNFSHETFLTEILQLLWKYDGIPSLSQKDTKEEDVSSFHFVVNSELIPKITDFLESKKEFFQSTLKDLEKDFTSVSILHANQDQEELFKKIEDCFTKEKPLFLSKETGLIALGVKNNLVSTLMQKVYKKLSSGKKPHEEKK